MRASLSGGCKALALVATTVLAGCIGQTRGAELYPEVAGHQNEEIKAVHFEGGDPFGSDTLQALIQTAPTRCNFLGLPICVPLLGGPEVHRLNVEVVRRDVARLMAFYRREGYFGTRVTPHAEPEKEGDEDVEVTFNIRRGDPIILDSLTITGAEEVLDADSLKQRLPIKTTQIFNVGRFDAAADQLLRTMQSRGYAYAEVLRNYTVDTLSDRAVATLDAVPGVQVRVDSIVVLGADHLGRKDALRQLTFRKGDLLRLPGLVESQRNLYSLSIVQLASVTIAPDSLQKTQTDSATTTVLVSIAEAPVNQAEAAVGFGTVECARANGEWTNRSFTGGARTLNIVGSVSRIGVGGITQSGVGNKICSGFAPAAEAQDTVLGNWLDYRLAATFTQPYFLSPRNHLTVTGYIERLSEPPVYQRQAEGGTFSVNHRFASRRILTTSLNVVRAKTVATPVLFCSAFQICVPGEIERLTIPRFRNTIAFNYIDDHTNNPLDATRGYALRSGIAWAAPWLSSSLTFARWTGDASWYREFKRGYVLATSLRLGNFFKTASLDPSKGDNDFLPPEERFFAGGATTVRGFTRNQLGQGVYVTTAPTERLDTVTVNGEPALKPKPDDPPLFVPTGGTSMGIVNAELRFPSPFLPRLLRLAAFIDGGAVGTGNVWNLDGRDWRFTPGAGIRINTPVGPARVDVAYNPYNPVRGVLFQATSSDVIIPINPDYAPPPPGFFGRMRVSVAIGQAF